MSIVSATVKSSESPFDSIRRYDQKGNEWWSARELMKMLGYLKWQMFQSVINIGVENLESAVGDTSDHALLLEVTLKFQVTIDYKLSRIACYHIALACDSREKPNVKAAKHYFATKTREAAIDCTFQNKAIMNIVPVSSLEVSNLEGELVVDSRLIADELQLQHETIIKNIRKYAEKFQAMGNLRFEIGTSKPNANGACHQVTFAYLNELQSSFLMTLSKNTEAVVQCKFDLAVAFDRAKQIISTVIPAQSERIQELQMELEIERLKTQREARQDTRIALHGLATTLLLEGKSDAVIEIEKPVLEVIDQRNNTSYKGQTLTQIKDFLLKKHGLKYKTGADIKRVLEQKGMGHLVAQTPRSILSDYVPLENQQAVYDALVGIPIRQMLLGE